MNRVFVYGTLLSGESNNYLLRSSERMGDEVISGFVMVSAGSFPALIPDENTTTPILGEVWRIDDDTFKSLDSLEGYPRFYDRMEVDTFDGKAWVYFMHRDNNRLSKEVIIESGSWKQYLEERNARRNPS